MATGAEETSETFRLISEIVSDFNSAGKPNLIPNSASYLPRFKQVVINVPFPERHSPLRGWGCTRVSPEFRMLLGRLPVLAER